MRLPRIVRKIFATLGITLLVAGCAYYYAITPHHSSAPPDLGYHLKTGHTLSVQIRPTGLA
jgi:hypothetical protein